MIDLLWFFCGVSIFIISATNLFEIYKRNMNDKDAAKKAILVTIFCTIALYGTYHTIKISILKEIEEKYSVIVR
jgi:hypothetical protein